MRFLSRGASSRRGRRPSINPVTITPKGSAASPTAGTNVTQNENGGAPPLADLWIALWQRQSQYGAADEVKRDVGSIRPDVRPLAHIEGLNLKAMRCG